MHTSECFGGFAHHPLTERRECKAWRCWGTHEPFAIALSTSSSDCIDSLARAVPTTTRDPARIPIRDTATTHDR